MKADQIAYYCCNDFAVQAVKEHFGLLNAKWIKDTVKSRSIVAGLFREDLCVNVAELQFNYDLGIELEIIRYTEGNHWNAFNVRNMLTGNSFHRPFISHIGFHLEDGEEFPKMEGANLVQETFTLSHTSEYLTTGAGAGRKYHYRIFEIGHMNYVKYIRRIHPER